jgi:hypothetical protein
MAIGVERQRPPVSTQELPDQCEIATHTFRFVEVRRDDRTRCIIDGRQENALRSALFEPGMVRAVNLNEFAAARSSHAHRVEARLRTMPVFPEAGLDHRFAKSLGAQDEVDGRRDEARFEAIVARTATFARGNPAVPIDLQPTQEPADLPLGNAQLGGNLGLGEALLAAPQEDEAFQFGSGQGQDLHGRTSDQSTGHFYLGENRTSQLGADSEIIKLTPPGRCVTF